MPFYVLILPSHAFVAHVEMGKDRIYDFKDLKSLLPALPADTGAASDVSGKKPAPGTDRAGGGLPCRGRNPVKPGMKVVLMDSEHRGKVLSAGRNVKIELEDGLVIDAEYGEFAVTDPAEEKLLLGTAGYPAAGTKENVRRSFPENVRQTGNYEMEVDLHMEALSSGHPVCNGRQLEYQLEFFRHILRKNIRHRGMKISFIHGVGDGILRSRLCKELDEVFALKCTYSSSPAVTVVTIR